MSTTTWQQLFSLGGVLMIAGGGSMAFNVLGSSIPALGLFTLGLVLVAAGLTRRRSGA